MDIEAVRSTLEQASLASLGIGLAIGFLFSFILRLLAIGTIIKYLQRQLPLHFFL
jgi:hypothetical protein